MKEDNLYKDDQDDEVISTEEMEKRLTDWENPPKVSDLKLDLTDAKTNHDTQLAKINHWLDNLHVQGKAKPKKATTQSSVQPQVIKKQAEWRYPALSEPFLSTEDVFNVDPITAEDKQAAKQNALVLNNQFNTKINKVAFFDTSVRTLVNEGTLICRIGWNYQTKEVDVEKPIIMTVPIRDPLIAQQMVQQGQQPVQQLNTGETELVTETKIVANHPTVEVCDTSHIVIDPSCKGDINKAKFVIYDFETSLAELRKDGKYENLDKIVMDTSSVLSQPDYETTEENSFNFNDEPRKRIVAYEYWGYWDIHGTGKVESFVATWIGSTMIRLEENPMPDGKLPFVVVQNLPVKGSIYGEPDGALIEDNQKIIGAVTRGMVDLMAKSANGQVGSSKEALDVTNKRKFDAGLNYEINQNADPASAFYMHKYPEIPQSAPLMINMQAADAEALTGVKAFSSSNGLSSQSLGESVGGIRSALDATSKRERAILRRLAEGVKDIGRKMIAMNAEFLDETEIVRITAEEFVPVRRDDLAGNFDLSLTISTPEADNDKAQELAFMLQTMGQTMDPGMSKMLLEDIATLRKMPALALRIKEYEPKPDPMAVKKAELEIKLLEQQIYNENAKGNENNANANLDNAKSVTEKAKARDFESTADKKDLDYLEQENGVHQERKLEENNQKHKQALQAKALEAQLNRSKQSN